MKLSLRLTEICCWFHISLGLFLQMKDVNDKAPKKFLSRHILFPHMRRWESGCISDISHSKLKYFYWCYQDLYGASHAYLCQYSRTNLHQWNLWPKLTQTSAFFSMREISEIPVLSPKLDKSSLKAFPSHSKWELIRLKIQKLLTLQL